MSTVLTTGRPWRVIALFAVPLLIGNVVQQLYQFVDAIVVGRHLGVDALAAVGATGSMLFLLLGFAWGLTSGFAIPTAQAFGAQDFRAVRRSVATGTLLTGACTVLLTVGAPLLSRPLLELLQTPPDLMDDAVVFAQISFLGAGALMFFNYLSAIIRAIGDSRTPLVFLTLACGLNVALVIVMVGPLGWGVGGAALATVVSQAVSVVLCLEFVRRRMPVLHVTRTDWRVTRAELGAHLRLGLPMGFQASIIAIGTLAVQVALNELGTDAVAAYTAASRVDGLAVALLQSLGLAVSMYVAQNHGGGRPDRIRRGVPQANWISVAAAIVLGALMIAFGSALGAAVRRRGFGRGGRHRGADARDQRRDVLDSRHPVRASRRAPGHRPRADPDGDGRGRAVHARRRGRRARQHVRVHRGAASNPLAWLGAASCSSPRTFTRAGSCGRRLSLPRS